MFVIKRDGNKESVKFDKITSRIEKLLYGINDIDATIITQKICNRIYPGISTTELDNLAAEVCMSMVTDNPNYGIIGSRIIISNHQKNTNSSFLEVINILKNNKDINGNLAPLVSEELLEVTEKYNEIINDMINMERDYLLDYFSFKTLEKAYLLKVDKKVIERPQHLFMRVAIGIHGHDIDNAIKTYNNLSLKNYTHATPTLFNAGTVYPQLSSCFLSATEDSVEGIYETITDCAKISKWAGGIGVHISNIRADGSYIRKTGGTSNGIMPMLKVYNDTARFINQSGKRNGSFACFVKNTKICTINEGVKNIQDVKLGDLVVTHKNRVRPVVQIHKNPLENRKIYKVSIMYNKDIYVTGNHRFWSFYTKKYKSNKLSYGWNSVEELKEILDNKKTTRQSCYVSIPINNNIEYKVDYINLLDYKDSLFDDNLQEFKEIDDNKILPISYGFDKNGNKKTAIGQAISKEWVINEDLANIFGIWLGDGCIRKYKNRINGISFSVHKDNKKLISYIVNSCKKIFMCKITIDSKFGNYSDAINMDDIELDNNNDIEIEEHENINYTGLELDKKYINSDKDDEKTKNCININVNSRTIGKMFNHLFGSYFNGKKLPNMIFKWSKNLVTSLLAGLITTDGHITKNKQSITLGLSNKYLMSQIYYLSRNNGIRVTSLRKSINKSGNIHYTTSIKSFFELSNNIYKLYSDNRMDKIYNKNYDEDDRFLKILSISETDIQDDFVYTLGVEDDHSYMAEGILVENCYLEPWHADIFTFLDAKKNHGAEEERARDLFYALWIPDLFMEKVEKDEEWYLMCPDKCPDLADVYGEDFNKLYQKYVDEKRYNKQIKARDIWESIISSQVETGTPYMLYKDAANIKSNQKNIGTIKSSNLCVSGDTMILTKEGYYPIKNLENSDIEVWNGKEWSKTNVKKTGENQKLLTIKFSNGMELKCTEYHKFYIETSKRPSQKSKTQIIEAKKLEKNMKIIRCDFELSNDNNNELKYAYTHGFYCADGTNSIFDLKYRCNYKRQKDKYFCGRHLSHNRDYQIDDEICCANSCSNKPMICLYGEKIKLLDYIDKISYGEYIEKNDKINISLPYDISKKYYVPINNNIKSKIKWLEGYLDGDGCINKNDGIKNIQYTSTNLEFMRNILFLLQTLGISSQIKIGKKEGKALLPDGNGGKKYYKTQTVYRSNIDSIGLDKLIKLGFNPKRLDISNNRLPHNITNMFIKIEDIIDNNLYEDTYCFNEPLEHKGIFNGIITGQCAEIIEVSNKAETSVCNLASICLQNVLENCNINDFFTHINWVKSLSDEDKKLYDDMYDGELMLFSKDDCVYCKLLKALLKKTGLKYIEIDSEKAEILRIQSEPSLKTVKPFETVPQLFSVHKNRVVHFGGYDDVWEILKPRINYKKLERLSYELTINLNKIIDKNFYPIEKARTSNMRHRPIGIGVQGLADLFIKLKLSFDSEESMKINKKLFETIYHGALRSSIDLAETDGAYSTFKGSPLSEGKLQYNLWGLKDEDLSELWKWDLLREKLMKVGARNSLLIALMPTASTSQIMGSTEAFEPFTSNIYTRRTLAGEFTVVNKYLMEDLIDLDLWNEDIKDRIIYDKGSVKNLKIPKFLKDIYKTVWEISQKNLITMSADRGPFVCQSQSLNLFFEKPNFKTLTSAHFIAWKSGLKTGSYYIRSKPALSSQRFGFDAKKEQQFQEEDEKGCVSCSA